MSVGSERQRPGGVAAPTYTHEITARDEDIDALGHVSNIVYVRWIQDVATAHSDAVGLDYAAYTKLGGIFVVRRHEVEYVVPALAGDVLCLHTWVEWWRGPLTERRTKITRVRDGKEIARAATLWVYVSVPEGKAKRIPESVQRAFTDAPHQPPSSMIDSASSSSR